MRKLLFVLLAGGLAFPSLAQTEQGAKLIGVSVGNARYTTFTYTKRTEFSADLVPSVGWFVADNLMIGAGLNLGYSGSNSELIGTNTVVEFRSRGVGYGLLPQARYYLPFGSKHRLFAHLSGGLTRYQERLETTEGPRTTTSKSHHTERSIYGGLGYNYFLSPNVALEALAGYRRTNVPDLAGNAAGALSVRLGLSVFLPSKSAGTPAP